MYGYDFCVFFSFKGTESNENSTFEGVRKPPVPFGLNGRSVSGSVVPSSTLGLHGDMKMRLKVGPDPTDIRTANFSVSSPEHHLYDKDSSNQPKRKYFLFINIYSNHFF